MHHTAITMNSNQLTSWNEITVAKKIKTHLVKQISTTVQETQVITAFTTTCRQTLSWVT